MFYVFGTHVVFCSVCRRLELPKLADENVGCLMDVISLPKSESMSAKFFVTVTFACGTVIGYVYLETFILLPKDTVPNRSSN